MKVVKTKTKDKTSTAKTKTKTKTLGLKTKTKTKTLFFLSSRRLEAKTLVSRITSLLETCTEKPEVDMMMPLFVAEAQFIQ